MKEFFFTSVLLAVPLVIVSAILYYFGHGLVTVIADWRLGREMEQLRQESAARRRDRAEVGGSVRLTDATIPDDILAGSGLSNPTGSAGSPPVFDLNDLT